jgi:uncharacterized hydantoinase/oxoprolinase family protein
VAVPRHAATPKIKNYRCRTRNGAGRRIVHCWGRVRRGLATDCEINSLAIEMLHLENTPAFRLREARDE